MNFEELVNQNPGSIIELKNGEKLLIENTATDNCGEEVCFGIATDRKSKYKMKIKFKYNVGDVVTLMKIPSQENMALGKYYIFNDEFKPKEYKIEQCKYQMIGTEEPKILYNLYAYCDEYIHFHNWIPEDDLSGTINEHEEDVEFISHDKEILSIGDDVIANAFYGDYENSDLSPSLTFTYKGTIVGFEYEINEHKTFVRRALVEKPDGTNHFEITPYLVKKMDETFAFEYVKFCKRDRFNPIKESERQYSKNKKFLEEIHLWDKVLEIYNNWNKYRKDGKTTEKKKTVKKEKPKTDINKLLNSLSEDEINELKKQLLKK